MEQRERRQTEIRVNRRIRVPEVRVIDEAGEQLGVMETFKAIALAGEKGLDLVEVSPKAVPPVCRILDYGKYKYLQKKKAAETRVTQRPIKEVKLRYMTDPHDVQTKIAHIAEFLLAKFKVKLLMTFRGREIVHKNLGLDKIREILAAVDAHGAPEGNVQAEGRTLQVILSPK